MRSRLLASSMIMGVALAAANIGHAADATATTTTTDATAVQELVVTGSRIPQPNLTSISPIQSVNAQEFKLQGHTQVIDLLNSLPQNAQNNTSDFSNTSN